MRHEDEQDVETVKYCAQGMLSEHSQFTPRLKSCLSKVHSWDFKKGEKTVVWISQGLIIVNVY